MDKKGCAIGVIEKTKVIVLAGEGTKYITQSSNQE